MFCSLGLGVIYCWCLGHYHTTPGSGDSSVVEQQTRDGKFSGLNPGRRTFFPWSIFCADSYFAICLTPHVTAVARKRTRSFCQKCRWQVTTKHACTLCVPMPTCAYVALNDDTTVTGAWFYGVHRTCTDATAVSDDTSHVTTKQCCTYYRTHPFFACLPFSKLTRI